jgi:hypothetical protein
MTMNRRCFVVSAAIFVPLIALIHSGTSITGRAEALKKQIQSGCVSCANEAARKTTKGSSKRRTRFVKSTSCHSKNYVDPKIARNYNAAMRDMKRSGIKPRVTSAWRSSQTQARLHRCSLSTRCRRSNPGLYRALPPGHSIHEAGFAVDIAGVATGPRGGKQITPRGRRIVSIMKKNGFKWRYGLKDPVHFEADPTKHGYRSVKQAIARSQTTCQLRLARSKSQKRSSNKVAVNGVSPKPRLASDTSKSRMRAVKLKA